MSEQISQSGGEFVPPPLPPPPEVEVKAPRPTKLRVPAIALVVLGIIFLIGGIAKLIPGGIGTGVAFALWGLSLFGFSFVPLPLVDDVSEPPLSGIQKLLGIFYEPTRVFRNLRAHPHWLAAFLVIGTISAVYSFAFVQRLTPERLVTHEMDALEQSPFKPPPDRMDQMREDNLQARKQPIQRAQTFAKTYIGLFFFAAFVAGICLLGLLAFGGRINFWQAFAAVLWGYVPVIVITKLVSLLLLYIKSPDDVHPTLNADSLVQDNLGILFVPKDHPALFVLASSIGILSFYGLWLRVKGLQNAGYKVSSSAAWMVSIGMYVIALILGAIFATIFSSFIS